MVTKGQGNTSNIAKKILEKTRYCDEVAEPWVQCDYCQRWVHQICALFNIRKNLEHPDPDSVLYMCPQCRIDSKTGPTKVITNGESKSPATSRTPSTRSPRRGGGSGSTDVVANGHASEVPKPKASPRNFASTEPTKSSPRNQTTEPVAARTSPRNRVSLENGGAYQPNNEKRASIKQEHSCNTGSGSGSGSQTDAGNPSLMCASEMTAGALPQTSMGDYIEQKAKECLHDLGAGEAASSITIRVVGNYERSVVVYPLVKKHFKGKGKGEVYPDEMDYHVKNIFLFQKLDGVDVCLFAM
jgi:hypothetical protein